MVKVWLKDGTVLEGDEIIGTSYDWAKLRAGDNSYYIRTELIAYYLENGK